MAHRADVTYTTRPGLSTLAGRWAGMGPYYAMFPVEFALAVVAHFSKPGQRVLDPFCGRGTTLYAASYQSRRGLGVEINPVGWVFGKTKLRAAHERDVLCRLREVADNAHNFNELANDLPSFFHWAFSSRVCCFLLSARHVLDWQHNLVDRTLVAFLLVYLHGKWGQALSNQLPQTKSMSPDYSVRWWRERDMRPPEIDPVEFMTKRIRWRYQKGRPSSRSNDIILGDAVEVLSCVKKTSGFQLLLTSPPYYSVTNYFYDQWLRLWLLGGTEKPKSMGEMSHLKNSEPRIIGVSEGSRVKSTNIGHHSSSRPNSSPFARRNRYEPKDHTRFPPTTHVVGPRSLPQPGRGPEPAKPGSLRHALSQGF